MKGAVNSVVIETFQYSPHVPHAYKQFLHSLYMRTQNIVDIELPVSVPGSPPAGQADANS